MHHFERYYLFIIRYTGHVILNTSHFSNIPVLIEHHHVTDRRTETAP